MDYATQEHTILASSASGLLMTPIQKVTARPERCVLAHPMLPVHLIPLVEVVGGEETSKDTVKITADLLRKIGKTPVILNKEVSGYIVNRFQAAVLREAIDIVDKGIVNVEAIDTAFCKGIGLRDPIIGPFLRIHLAGNGIEQFLENYSQSYSYRWESMESWTSIPPSAAKKVIDEANKMDTVKSRSIEDLIRWRDKKLVELLKVIYDD
jgi:3-hydroxypropionate dehydrogenase (NADP+)